MGKVESLREKSFKSVQIIQIFIYRISLLSVGHFLGESLREKSHKSVQIIQISFIALHLCPKDTPKTYLLDLLCLV